jgi:hypothetical protein
VPGSTLLYIYRVLLTGIHLMRTGELNANLVELNGAFCLPYVPELIERKVQGEHTELGEADFAFHDAEFERLYADLEAAREASHLPGEAQTRRDLESLLRRLR